MSKASKKVTLDKVTGALGRALRSLGKSTYNPDIYLSQDQDKLVIILSDNNEYVQFYMSFDRLGTDEFKTYIDLNTFLAHFKTDIKSLKLKDDKLFISKVGRNKDIVLTQHGNLENFHVPKDSSIITIDPDVFIPAIKRIQPAIDKGGQTVFFSNEGKFYCLNIHYMGGTPSVIAVSHIGSVVGDVVSVPVSTNILVAAVELIHDQVDTISLSVTDEITFIASKYDTNKVLIAKSVNRFSDDFQDRVDLALGTEKSCTEDYLIKSIRIPNPKELSAAIRDISITNTKNLQFRDFILDINEQVAIGRSVTGREVVREVPLTITKSKTTYTSFRFSQDLADYIVDDAPLNIDIYEDDEVGAWCKISLDWLTVYSHVERA